MANAKLDIDIAGFQNSINTAKGILKGLNAEMKNADAEFKATGNAEKALADKTKALNSQLQVQKGIADQAAQALKAMDDAGIKPTDKAYQKLYATMMNANAGMNEAQAALNGLSAGEKQAAQEANNLSQGVQSIGKKMSLDQVISGIDKITSGLENAAKKAVNLGKELWNNIMDTAMMADDIATQAKIFDMTPEQYQKYKGVFDTVGDITIQEWAAAKRKVERAMVDPSNDQIDVLRALGFVRDVPTPDGYEAVTELADNWEQVFWDAATKLKSKVESGEITSEMADVYGEALFGKKYSSLKTLIDLGQEGFKAAYNTQAAAADEAIEKDAALNDTVINLKKSLEALELQVLSGVAPELTKAANAIDGLLGSLLEYLKKPEGQKMLEDLGTAVSGLFDDLGKIDPAQVVEGFVGVFTSITDALKWLVENKDTVGAALGAIVTAWGALELTGGALSVLKLINGLRDLGVIGGGAAATGSTGTSWFAGIGPAIAEKLPVIGNWLSANGMPVMDWLTHESEIAPVLNGLMTWDEWWTGKQQEVQKNAESFGSDWEAVFGGQKENKGRNSAGLTDEEINNMRLYYQFLENVNRLGYDKVSDESKLKFAGYQTWLDEAFQGREAQWNAYRQAMAEALRNGQVTLGDDFFNIGKDGKPVEVPAELDIETTSQEIVTKVGEVKIPVTLDLSGYAASVLNFLGIGSHANGLPFVPYDNYLARLHKGERVLTANQNRHYTYNSNNYFGNVNLNNGQDIEALCNSIDRHNRRQRSGYGS